MEAVIIKILFGLPIVSGIVLMCLKISGKIKRRRLWEVLGWTVVISGFFFPIWYKIPEGIYFWDKICLWFFLWCVGFTISGILALVSITAVYLLEAMRMLIVSLNTPRK